MILNGRLIEKFRRFLSDPTSNTYFNNVFEYSEYVTIYLGGIDRMPQATFSSSIYYGRNDALLPLHGHVRGAILQIIKLEVSGE